MTVAELLAADRQRFLRFTRGRVRDPELAEDLLQRAYVRALEKGNTVAEADRVVPWFYQVLRNTIVDHARHRNAEARALSDLQHEPRSTPEPTKGICRCVLHAVSSLRPEYAAIVRAVDIAGEPVKSFAGRSAISAGTASVRLHRARRKLSTRLKEICGSCALDRCGNCDCGGAARSTKA